MNLRLASAWFLVAITAVACASTRAAAPSSPGEGTFQCPSIKSTLSPDPDDPLVMDAGQLADQMHLTLGEAVAILGMQGRIGLFGAALDHDHPQGYGGIYIAYEPCFHVAVRLTEGDGASVIDAAQRDGFDALIPFIRFKQVEFAESELVRAQEALMAATADIDLSSGTYLVEGLVEVTVENAEDARLVRERLNDAIADGQVVLPMHAFRIEVGQAIAPDKSTQGS
jgi:hypothetical protein